MKTLLSVSLLSLSLFTPSLSFAWSNPSACDPLHTDACWIKCYNSDSVLGGKRRLDVYVAPAKDSSGKAAFLVRRERVFSYDLKELSTGTISRATATAGSIVMTFSDANVSINAKTDLANVIVDNGYSLLGTIALRNNSQDVTCDYETPTWMNDYESVYDPEFPKDFYNQNK